MSHIGLKEALAAAKSGGYALAGLVVLSWEDARAFIEAAEEEGAPVILMAGPGARAFTPLPVLGKMFDHLAQSASVPVVSLLDHGRNLDECRAAIEAGFSSVMFDGSKLALAENIAQTRAARALSSAHGVSLEGELGYVGYAEGADSNPTIPEEAGRFARETGVDALAVSIGNTHLQQSAEAVIDWARLRAIEAQTDIPLVLHGGSGVAPEIRAKLAHASNVCKFNIGTEIRMAYGRALRGALEAEPDRFDRLAIARDIHPSLVKAARRAIANLRPERS